MSDQDKGKKRKIKDIDPFENINFDWSDGKRADSLKIVHQGVRDRFDKAIAWYKTKRGPKRILAIWLRIAAIILGAFATAIPSLCEIDLCKPWLRAGYATVLGIIVATLLMLDKFIGASSAWARYIMAETALKELLDEFNLAFPLESSDWAATGPTVEQTKHALTALQSYLARANQIVRDETAQWKSEFQSAIQQIDDSAKNAPRKVDEVVATIKIANPDRLVTTWKVSIDGSTEEEVTGDAKTVRRTPGPITVRIKADVKTAAGAGRPYSTETADILAAGMPKTITITLPLS